MSGVDIHATFERLAAALHGRSPVAIDGVPHDVWLMSVDPRSTQPDLVRVVVAARTPAGQTQLGEVYVTLLRLEDDDFADAVIGVLTAVVRGEVNGPQLL